MSFHISVGIFSCDRDVVTRLTTIHRLLAPLERQIVMNLLWLESAIATQAMSAWVIRETKCEKYTHVHKSSFRVTCWWRNDRLYNDTLETLGNLHILPKSPVKLALNATFKSSFRQAITGGLVFFPLYMKISPKLPNYSKEELVVVLELLQKRKIKNKLLIWRLLIVLHWKNGRWAYILVFNSLDFLPNLRR